MQIVVEVTNKLYDAIKNGFYDNNTRKMAIAIGNGIVLPKGHGDLIDKNNIIGDIHGVRSITTVLNAPIIIPADKEVES